jgi:peptidoglycan/LPS O-acetylase OafA/YrhL
MLTSPKGFNLNYWFAVVVIVFPTVLIMATLINKYIEIPAMRYLKRISRNKQTSLAQVAD